MTNEEKELLLKDLFARMPYGVIVQILPEDDMQVLYGARLNGGKWLFNDAYYLEEIKPCLRPVNTMTEKELFEAAKYMLNTDNVVYTVGQLGSGFYKKMESGNMLRFDETMFKLGCSGTKNTDWLIANHFDFRGLIRNGLATAVKADIYKKDSDDSVTFCMCGH